MDIKIDKKKLWEIKISNNNNNISYYIRLD